MSSHSPPRLSRTGPAHLGRGPERYTFFGVSFATGALLGAGLGDYLFHSTMEVEGGARRCPGGSERVSERVTELCVQDWQFQVPDFMGKEEYESSQASLWS